MQSKKDLNPQIVSEVYRALVLMGANSDLLGTIGSWGDSLPDADVLANLKAWNEATLQETKGRIEHYGMSFLPSDCNRDEAQQMSVA